MGRIMDFEQKDKCIAFTQRNNAAESREVFNRDDGSDSGIQNFLKRLAVTPAFVWKYCAIIHAKVM